ncbi:MAG: hypothetical protein AAGB13_07755, partial [Cyanobacteria bacterium P01_F01_bin.33]
SGETSQAPLLTSSIPLGLQFGEEPGSIHSQARTIFQDLSMLPEELLNDPEFFLPPIPVGLEVSPNHTLALVGSDVTVEGDVESIATAFEGFAALQAPGGRVEVGSVGSGERVSLTPVEEGWELGYDSVVNFQDVTLSGTLLQASSQNESSGAIQVQGKTVAIANDTQINSLNEIGSVSAQPIVVSAADSIELSERSSITTAIFDGPGTAGDIILQSDRLSVLSDSAIDASSQGTGTGGQVIIDANDTVKVGEMSFISTTGFGDGDAGSISITTEHLSLFDGGRIASSNSAAGAGGNIDISALEWVELRGEDSRLIAESQGAEPAGNVNIVTGELSILDGAFASVSSLGTGDAGALSVEADSVALTDGGQLTAATALGDGGDIYIDVQGQLELIRGGSISTSIGEEIGGGDGGNITIHADFVTAVPEENSDITANAFAGRGGNVAITANGVLGITPREALTDFSDITASSEANLDGTITINSPNVEADRDAVEEPNTSAPPPIARDCRAGSLQTGGSFVDVGRGGLPPSPTQANGSTALWEDLRAPMVATERSRNEVSAAPATKLTPTRLAIVEAQGWHVNEANDVVLVADASSAIALMNGFKSDRTCASTTSN